MVIRSQHRLRLTSLDKGKRPKLENPLYAVSSSESGHKPVLPRRKRLGPIRSCGSMTNDQTSTSLANLQVSWLNHPLAIDNPQESLLTSTHLSRRDSIGQSRQDPCSPRDQLLSGQKLPGILSISTQPRGPCPRGQAVEPSSDEIPQLISTLNSPIEPSYSSSASSLASKYNTSSSPSFTPVTPQDDRSDRAHRALSPPPASSTPSASQSYFGARTQPTSPPVARYQPLSHSFRIPPRPPQIVITKEQKLEGSSGSPGNANLTC